MLFKVSQQQQKVQERWDWTALGQPLLSHDKEGRAELLLCKQLNSLEESGAGWSTIRDGASVGERLKNNGAAKETTEILFPQIPKSAQREETKTVQRTTKAFFAFSPAPKKKKQ